MAVKLADAYVLISGDDDPLEKILKKTQRRLRTWARNADGLAGVTLRADNSNAISAINGVKSEASGLADSIDVGTIDVDITGDSTQLEKTLSNAQSTAKSLVDKLEVQIVGDDSKLQSTLTKSQSSAKALADSVNVEITGDNSMLLSALTKAKSEARSLSDVKVEVDADIGQLKSELNKADAEVERFAKGAARNIDLIIGGAIAGVAAGLTSGFVDFGKSTVGVFGEIKASARDISAFLGIPIAEAERFAEVAKRVYGNNFGESVTDATDAVKLLAQQMSELSSEELQNAAEDAFALRDVFGVELNESIDAAKTLMTNFGLSSEEAFDLLAAGQQRGLNRSGDLLDTIGEYSNQFAEGGASAEEFFNFLESGTQGGVLGTDKAADAFKEFRLRINDGTEATKEAVEALFLSEAAANSFFDEIKSGQLTTTEAFEQIRDALEDVEDPIELMQISTALIGTQFEDLGAKAVLNLTNTGRSFKDVTNATESLNTKYKSLGNFISGTWRRAQLSIEPFISRLVDLANDNLPQIEKAFDFFDTKVIPIFGEKLLTGIQNAIDSMAMFASGVSGPEFEEFVTKAFDIALQLKNIAAIAGGLLLKAITSVTNVFDFLTNELGLSNETIVALVSGFGIVLKIFGPASVIISAVTGAFSGLTAIMSGVSIALAALGGPITLLIAAVGALSFAWTTNLFGIRDVTDEAMTSAAESLGIPIEPANGLIGSIKNLFSIIEELFTTEEIGGFVTRNIADLDVFKRWFDENMPRIRSIIDKVWKRIQKIWDNRSGAILTIATAAFANIKIVIDTTVQSILDIVTLGLQLLNGEWEAAGDTLEGIIDRIWVAIKDIFQNSIDAIIAIINNVDWLGLGSNIINGIRDGVQSGASLLYDAANSIISELKDRFASIDLKQTGRNIMSGLRTGFTEGWNSFLTWFKEQAASLTSFLPDLSSLNPFGRRAVAPNAGQQPQPQTEPAQSTVDLTLSNMSAMFASVVEAIANQTQQLSKVSSSDFVALADSVTNGMLEALRADAITKPLDALSRPQMELAGAGGDTYHITINAEPQTRDDWEAVARTVFDEGARRKRR